MLLEITDYWRELNVFSIPVIELIKMKEFRIAANNEGVFIFLYKRNSTVNGWHPGPFERVKEFDKSAKIFANEDKKQGVRFLQIGY